MIHSDFKWVNFDTVFNSTTTEATRTFQVDGIPFDTGYLLIQHFDVELPCHSISINGRNLPSFDIPAQQTIDRAWFLWMDRIPEGFLKQGTNEITIKREGSEFFKIANVVVNWRERG